MKCKPFSVKNLWRLTFGTFFLVALVGCASVVSTKELFTSDRRTDGARIEDVAIQLKAFNRLNEQFGRDRSRHIRVSSFNRQVLITGFVPDQSTKATVGQIIGRIENTKSPIINELFVNPHTEDAPLGINKFLEERLLCDFARAGFDTRVTKVIVESGTVYLTGMVSAEESRKYAQLVSRTPGVRRVVLAYEVLTEDQARVY
jgi:osmotically-inducible protein OsmY